MRENKGQRIYKVIMLVIITALITSIITGYATYTYINKNESGKVGSNSSMFSGLEYTLTRFRKELERKYKGDIDDNALIEGAIKGYVDGLGDPYTTYYTKEEMDEIMEETNGNFVGIGVYMTQNKEKNMVEVIKPIENSPAETAGIIAGDLIVKIDEKQVTGDKLEEAANKIRGEEGTKVKIEILRGTEVKTFELTRKKVLISHIVAKKLQDNIGYILISEFEGGCANEFKEKYNKLKDEGIKKLIIDIRNNGGGIVDETIDILEMIVPKGATLLITEDKKGEEVVTKSRKTPIIDIPIVVLTNKYSASASEILAGALKDNGKAQIVGTTTYGKGVIQELARLTDGSGLKITTNEYFTPKHNVINKVGIKPDHEIDIPLETKLQGFMSEEEDVQLKKAIEVLKNMK